MYFLLEKVNFYCHVSLLEGMFFLPALKSKSHEVMHLCKFSQEMDAEEAVCERGGSKNPIGGMAVGWKGRKWNFILFRFFSDVGIRIVAWKIRFHVFVARKWMNIPRATMGRTVYWPTYTIKINHSCRLSYTSPMDGMGFWDSFPTTNFLNRHFIQDNFSRFHGEFFFSLPLHSWKLMNVPFKKGLF